MALYKTINEEDAVLIPKKEGEKCCNGIFYSEFLRGGARRYAATPMNVSLSPGHSDITRFRPWSPIATGNHLDRAVKITKVAQTNGTVEVFEPHSGISGPTSRRASSCPNLHERWTQPAYLRRPVAQLLTEPKSGIFPRLAREFDQ